MSPKLEPMHQTAIEQLVAPDELTLRFGRHGLHTSAQLTPEDSAAFLHEQVNLGLGPGVPADLAAARILARGQATPI